MLTLRPLPLGPALVAHLESTGAPHPPVVLGYGSRIRLQDTVLGHGPETLAAPVSPISNPQSPGPGGSGMADGPVPSVTVRPSAAAHT